VREVSPPVFRFAPSPNGRLHLGHAFSALLNRDLADALGGRLLLRIEDIDLDRCTPDFERGIHDDLGWLGIAWEGPVRRQSEHFDIYRSALERLVKADLAYPAFATRGETRALVVEHEAGGKRWPRDPDGVPHYPGLDRTLSGRQRAERMAEGRPFAWRLDMAAAIVAAGGRLDWTETAGVRLETADIVPADPAAWGDVVLGRRDVPTSYHLSVVVDDALQGVTHVVRGRDLYAATSVHRLLQTLLGLPAPVYHHHRLILGPDGRKLSKSQADTALAALRETGTTPADVRRMVGLG
jgi:glutamyl-Q tRNA(Asp) synthetase